MLAIKSYQGEKMNNKTKKIVMKVIQSVLQGKLESLTDDTPLISSEAQLDSMGLVELCLALEDKADELGFQFDWTSESAMSKSRGMFRTAGALAAEFANQKENSE